MIRQFETADLDAVVALWNETLVADKLTPDKLHAQLLCDDNFDPSLFLLHEAAGGLLGFAVGIVRRVPYYERGLQQGTGWLLAFGTAPGARRAGVASGLLAELEARLALRGVTQLVVGLYSPGYFMPGVDTAQYAAAESLLRRRGYQFSERHTAMARTLFSYTVPAAVQKKRTHAEALGYRFMRCPGSRAGELIAFLKQWFTAGWVHNAEQLLQQGLLCRQTWLCIDPAGQIAGFAGRGMGGQACRFGPFGVRPDCRNLSLGSILLCDMLYDMSCRGLYLAYFMTTDAPGARLYARHGFAPYRSFTTCTGHLPLSGETGARHPAGA